MNREHFEKLMKDRTQNMSVGLAEFLKDAAKVIAYSPTIQASDDVNQHQVAIVEALVNTLSRHRGIDSIFIHYIVKFPNGQEFMGEEYGIEVDSIKEYNGVQICTEVARRENVRNRLKPNEKEKVLCKLFRVHLVQGKLKTKELGDYEITLPLEVQSKWEYDRAIAVITQQLPQEFKEFVATTVESLTPGFLGFTKESFKQALATAELIVKHLLKAENIKAERLKVQIDRLRECDPKLNQSTKSHYAADDDAFDPSLPSKFESEFQS